MKSRNILSEGYICVLGAINGLLVGIAVEASRIIYAKYQMQRAMDEAAQHNGNTGYMLEPVMNAFIPFMCVIAFTAVSHLVHRYFQRRPQSLLLVWLLMGLISFSVRQYMFPLNQDNFSFVYVIGFVAVSYLIYWFWANHLYSRLLMWAVIGATAVLLVGTTVQIIGLFMVQRYELRQPLTWLFCLTLVTLINLIYGAIVQGLTPQHSLNRS